MILCKSIDGSIGLPMPKDERQFMKDREQIGTKKLLTQLDTRQIIRRKSRRSEIGVWLCVILSAFAVAFICTMAWHAFSK